MIGEIRQGRGEASETGKAGGEGFSGSYARMQVYLGKGVVV